MISCYIFGDFYGLLTKVNKLLSEKNGRQFRLDRIIDIGRQRDITRFRLDEIDKILESMKNNAMTYDDEIVRQLLDCVVFETQAQVKVVFVDGTEIVICFDDT